MKSYPRLFALTLFLAALQLAAGQETLIVQHSGNVNPVDEGFTLSGFGTPQIGPVADDQNLNAWSIGVSSSEAEYSQFFGSLTGQDWLLSITLRVVTPNTSCFGVSIGTGSSYFGLGFGSDANGNQIVGSRGTTFTIDGGSTYNNYQLLYSSTSDTASLWINGVEQLSGIPAQYGSSPYLEWGGGYQGSGSFQCNWNLVSLEIIPEPSTAALVFLGSGILIYVRRLRKKRRLA